MSNRQRANAARETVIDKLRQDGLTAAYERAIKLLNDDSVPATAQASLVRVVFGAAGVLNVPERDGDDKEAHEMSAEEIHAKLVQLRAELSLQQAQEGVFD